MEWWEFVVIGYALCVLAGNTFLDLKFKFPLIRQHRLVKTALN